MERISFTYQRWFLRCFIAIVTIPVALLIQHSIVSLLNIESASWWYILICAAVMLLVLGIYYKFSQTLFLKTGYYWKKNGTVYIQKQNKTYELNNIQWLRGTTVSAYGFAKSGMLVIQSEKEKLVLVSSSVEPVETFGDCELFALFELILACNAELKKDDSLDYWYEVKKE